MVDKYCYRIVWSEEDKEFVGLCAEFPSLSWLDKKADEAFAGIRRVVKATVNDMKKNDEPLPEPLSTKRFSGKFVIRIPPQLHRQLALQAQESQISLNRLIAAKLADNPSR